MSLLRSLLHRQDGQALPEFALVIPVLVLVLFAIIDFGKAFNYWNDATHIAAEGARYAAVNGKPYPAAAGSLQAQLLAQGDTSELRGGGTNSLASAAQVCVSFPSPTDSDPDATNPTPHRGDPVRVTMTFEYSWLPVLDLGSTEITSSAVMRLETLPTGYSAGCT
jgi:Flp pilus assembly protein TadG